MPASPCRVRQVCCVWLMDAVSVVAARRDTERGPVLQAVDGRAAHVLNLKDFARERGITRDVCAVMALRRLELVQVEGGRLGYDPAPLFGGPEEFSFEEIRLQQRKTPRQVVPPPAPRIEAPKPARLALLVRGSHNNKF